MGLHSDSRIPPLKNLVDRMLRQRADVLAFHSAPAAQGGGGAVLVLPGKRCTALPTAGFLSRKRPKRAWSADSPSTPARPPGPLASRLPRYFPLWRPSFYVSPTLFLSGVDRHTPTPLPPLA